MSTLKRSQSSSNIPRLSRIAVRQSATSRPPRSSSARPSSGINANLLVVPGSGTLGRSSSYSNLATPIRIKPATPSSGSSSTSKNIRMNDKEWQKAQAMRVKSFLINYDPEMPPLKPLCIRTYIHSMNILFKQLDNRISITLENYKESVPDYLRSFKYKYSIKPSVMKTPAVPSSWQYILQIWIWLIDLIELLHSPERVLLSDAVDNLRSGLLYTGVNYMADSFLAFNKAENQDKVNSDFVNNLAQIKNINLHDTTSAQNEDFFDTQLKTLADVEQSTVALIEERSKQVKELQDTHSARIQNLYDRRNELLADIKEINIKCKNIEIEMNEAKGKKEHLEAVISAQTCTKTEIKQLRDTYTETRNIEELKLQCLKEQEQMMDDYSVKINQQKCTIQSTIHKTNNRIAILSCKAPELKGIKMPEENLNESGFVKHLTEFTEKFGNVGEDLQKMLEELKLTFHKKQQMHRMDVLKKDELRAKMGESDKFLKERINSYAIRKEGLYDKIRNAQMELIEKEKKLEQLTRETAHINETKKKYENTLDICLKRCADLKRLQNESMVQAGHFFVSIHNTLVDTIHDNCEKMDKLNTVIENYFNSSADPTM